MGIYYDGTKLLSMKDINGNTPEIYLCTTNRTGGKTTYFGRLLVNKFLKGQGKFCLVYRYNYELEDCADKFFKDIGKLFFKDHDMQSKKKAKGVYHELFLDDVGCGYAISLNSADTLKKYSHMFSDVQRMFFDEFQSETNHYCTDEIRKLLSVHTSIARGQGKQIRYVPLYMCANPVSLINPYYTEMGIADRLKSDTRFLKGDGFVLEQGFNENASLAQQESGFNRAFVKNQYVAYSAQCVYLNDSQAFIEKPQGRSLYIATLKYMGTEYGVREFADSGLVYCDDKPDVTFPTRISVTTADHEVNFVMLKRNMGLIDLLRFYFDHGCFRFKNLKCKEVVLKALSY